MAGFTHLHLHTQYSLLDGAAHISKTLEKAKELGMTSVAITDHGVMYGVVEFYTKAVSMGIKPIIGCEVYTAPRSRFNKDAGIDKGYGHLVLLCKNEIGYKNLLSLVTKSNTEGFYYKPRVDTELLKIHSDGLIALSGCLRGDVATAYLKYGYDYALKKALELRDIFGKESFYLEIQNHGIEEEKQVAQALFKISSETGIGLVATNDVHYVEKEDAMMQDVLTCIQTGKKLSDTDRLKMEGDEYYLKSPKQMSELFSEFPDAIENTEKIAAECNLFIDTSKIHLPSIKIDTTLSHSEYLKNLCIDGLKMKYENPSKEHFERLDYELGVIDSMGYTDYFLIVWDFVNFSRKNKIAVGPGRGSAAGSLVSYCLDITQVDPVKYNLLFERFLNPERVTMPDIDIDFCYKRRDEVREYVAKKYGETKVAQIITFGTLAARAAIKDVGRAMGIPLSVTSKISSLVPNVLQIKLKDAIRESDELARLYKSDVEVKKLLDIAMKLEGFPRNSSTHAAGVVIGDVSLTNYVPLQIGDGGLLTQYPMSDLEKIGLLKMDFLSLRNLTIIDDCVEMIRKSTGMEFSIEDIPTDDKKTFELIQKGDTDAVFQLENPGLQTFMRKFMPKSLEDIIATTSLYRPGPMDQLPVFLENVANPEKIVYKHPLLKPILESTYGVVVYQEQVMKIVRSLGGYSLGRADLVRRSMAKKKFDEMVKEKDIFINGLEDKGNVIVEGAKRRGIDEKTAGEIFDSLIDFANYAFNKSHAACYALVAYRTAYLKAHYPTFYLASVLKNYAGYITKAVKYIASFKKYSINVLSPDVNKSTSHFSPEGNNVRFGLCWLKNVGDRFPNQIERERGLRGNFTSFEDFVKRMSGYDMNKRAIESMIKCGCFDSLHPNRRSLVYSFESVVDRELGIARSQGSGQLDWFSMGIEEETYSVKKVECQDFSKEDKLNLEYEYSGMYFSGHPLDSYRIKVEAFSTCSCFDVSEGNLNDSEKVTICGRIGGINQRRTKSGRFITNMTLSDFSGQCGLVSFDNAVSKYENVIYEGAVVCISAVFSKSDEEKEGELLLNSAHLLSKLTIGPDKSLYVRTDKKSNFSTLKKLFEKYPGESNLIIYFKDTNEVVRSDKSHRVSICDELLSLLSDCVGKDDIKVR